jgi:hypothetical protein
LGVGVWAGNRTHPNFPLFVEKIHLGGRSINGSALRIMDDTCKQPADTGGLPKPGF